MNPNSRITTIEFNLTTSPTAIFINIGNNENLIRFIYLKDGLFRRYRSLYRNRLTNIGIQINHAGYIREINERIQEDVGTQKSIGSR